MTNFTEVQAFILKLVGGIVAISVFALSSLPEPVLLIDPTVRAGLLLAALASFGLAVKQSYSAVQVSQAVNSELEFEENT